MSVLEALAGQPEQWRSAVREVRLRLLQEDVPLDAIAQWKDAVHEEPVTARSATLAALARRAR